MKTIIAGSRDITDPWAIDNAIRESGFVITEVVSGGARGVDRLGERFARFYGIPVKRFIPDWDGPAKKAAGHIRNAAMAEYAEALIAVYDGKSPGTGNMIKEANRRGLRVYVHLVGG